MVQVERMKEGPDGVMRIAVQVGVGVPVSGHLFERGDKFADKKAMHFLTDEALAQIGAVFSNEGPRLIDPDPSARQEEEQDATRDDSQP